MIYQTELKPRDYDQRINNAVEKAFELLKHFREDLAIHGGLIRKETLIKGDELRIALAKLGYKVDR